MTGKPHVLFFTPKIVREVHHSVRVRPVEPNETPKCAYTRLNSTGQTRNIRELLRTWGFFCWLRKQPFNGGAAEVEVREASA